MALLDFSFYSRGFTSISNSRMEVKLTEGF